MYKMFYRCESLIYLPNISKWDFSSVKSTVYMLAECESLQFLPNFSKSQIKKFYHTFYNSINIINKLSNA